MNGSNTYSAAGSILGVEAAPTFSGGVFLMPVTLSHNKMRHGMNEMRTSLTVFNCFLQTSFDCFNGNVRDPFPF
jgi:hypothetical protein